MSSPRIAVLGAGANGAGIGADLARAGLDVTLIEQWPEHVAAMRTRPLRVDLPAETRYTRVRAHNLCDVATLRDRFDLVFLLTKAYDTRWACELIKPLLALDGLVVGVQNGMTIDDIAEVVGPERAMGAVIELSAAMFEPGVVQRHSPHDRAWFALGGLIPEVTGRAPEVARYLGHAGTVEVTDDIRSAKWMKLLVNAGELVPCAILGKPMHAAEAMPGMLDFMLRVSQEAADAALLAGCRLMPIFGLDVDTADKNEFVRRLVDKVFRDYALPHTMTTVLHDWIKSRHSEADQINGLVVDVHRQHGGSAPANGRVVELAHLIEAGELKPGPANAELLLAPLNR